MEREKTSKTLKSSRRSISKTRNDQSGQALAEYIILVVLVAIVLIPISRLLPLAVQGYLRPFYYTISRSIP